MPTLGLEDHIVDEGVYAVDRAALPRGADPSSNLRRARRPDADQRPRRQRRSRASIPTTRPRSICSGSTGITTPSGRASSRCPGSRRLTESWLTGVEAPIVVAFGDRFPMIRAHKVLAAYRCLLAPRVITGQFDPTSHRAVWPSTGNYCRGGVAISRLMGCRGVAVLARGHRARSDCRGSKIGWSNRTTSSRRRAPRAT